MKKEMDRVALLIFTESSNREDAFQSRVGPMEEELAVLKQRVSASFDLFVPSHRYIRNKRDLRSAVVEVKQQIDICGCILYVGTFINASDIAMAVSLLNVPCALLGNHNRNTVSIIGFLAAAGALQQVCLPYKRLDGDIRDEATLREMLVFFSAAKAKNRLRGETFGMIGGRSLGIATGSADAAQWLKLFGVDIEHIDQMEIVERAKLIDSSRIRLYKDWVFENYGKVNYQEGRFMEEHLEKMICSYLAVKDIVHDYTLDFVGIKCQPDLSNGYVQQCFTVQLLNDPYDAEGEKDPVVCSCEADADGALTMQILKHLSGKPTTLQDVFCFENQRNLVLANCGAGASYYACYSPNMRENLQKVYLQPHGFGTAGGASVQFNYAPGTNTLARLTRSNLEYRMLITRGEVLERTREDISKYSWYRPTSVMELEVDNQVIKSRLSSNHLLCVEGDYVEELVSYCELNNIGCDLLVR